MNFEELRDIAREQKSKSRLTKLDSDFYERVRAYLDTLRREQETASARELRFLSDELKAATDRLQHIFNYRVRKILDLASLNLTGEVSDTEHISMMTPVEREIYHSVLDAMRKGWSVIEGTLAGEPILQADARTTVRAAAESADNEPTARPVARPADTAMNPDRDSEVAARVVGEGGATGDASGAGDAGDVDYASDAAAASALSDYTVVYVLKDIPTFVGADGNHYTLLRNDVVTLPNLNSRVLCKRRAVSPIALQ